MTLNFDTTSFAKFMWYVPGQLSKGAMELGAQKWENWNAGWNATAGVLHYLEKTNLKWAPVIGKVSPLFSIVGSMAACWELGKLMKVLDQRFHILDSSKLWTENTYSAAGWVGMAGLIAFACFVVGRVNRYFDLSDAIGKERHPVGEVMEQWVNVIRTVTNLALFAFSSENRSMFAANTLFHGGIVRNIATRRWLVVDKEDNNISFSYFYRLFPVPNTEGQMFYSCSKDGATRDAIRGLIKENNFSNTVHVSGWLMGVNGGVEKRYVVTVPQDNLPKCHCDQPPVYGFLTAFVKDLWFGNVPAYVQVTS
jgi:hypothetical protein